MKHRTALVATFLVLSLVICGLVATAEELTNDSRKTAVAVRITFRSPVRITGHGREFDTVDPSSGLSKVFVFSGGELRRNHTFEVMWSPRSRKIRSVEWLEFLSAEHQQEMEARSSCSCILSPSDSLGSRLDNAYKGIEICLEPGTYQLDYQYSIRTTVTIRGLGDSPSDVLLTCPDYSYFHIGALAGGSVVVENLSIAIPKHSKASIYAQNGQCEMRSVQVEQGSKFEAAVNQRGTLRIENCILTQVHAGGEGSLLVESTTFRGPANENAVNTAVWGFEEAQVTLLACDISGYSFAIFLQDDTKLEINNCVLAPGERSFRLDGSLSVSIIGSDNEIALSSLDPSYPWPPGFVKD